MHLGQQHRVACSKLSATAQIMSAYRLASSELAARNQRARSVQTEPTYCNSSLDLGRSMRISIKIMHSRKNA